MNPKHVPIYTERHCPKGILVFIILVGLTLLVRFPSLYTPLLDIDESQYGEFANRVLEGGIPYKDAVGEKPPLLYAYYLMVFGCFGSNSYLLLHAITLLLVGCTAFGIYQIGSLLQNQRVGWFAAILFTLGSTIHEMKIIATNGETLLNWVGVFTFVFLLKSRMKQTEHTNAPPRATWIWIVMAGLCAGSAMLFRHQGIVIGITGILFLLLDKRKRDLLPFFGGGAFIIGGIHGVLFAWGAWDAYWFWSWDYNWIYSEWGYLTIPLTKGLIRVGIFLVLIFWFWIGFAGLIKGQTSLKSICNTFCSRSLSFVIIWLCLAAMTIPLGFRFYSHYFILLYPPLSLIAAQGMDQLTKNQPLTKNRLIRTFVILLLLASVLTLLPRLDQDFTYSIRRNLDPQVALTSGVMPEHRLIGDYVKSHTNPEDHIFVWGFATPIYTYSDRSSASRFSWTDFLVGRIPGSPTGLQQHYSTWKRGSFREEAWVWLWKDFESEPPTIIVDTSTAGFHEYAKYPLVQYQAKTKGRCYALWDYIQKHYQFMATVAGATLYERKHNKKK